MLTLITTVQLCYALVKNALNIALVKYFEVV